MNQQAVKSLSELCKALIILVTVVLLTAMGSVRAEGVRNGLSVSMPNGYANITLNDLVLESTGGKVRWLRWWDGHHWKFNSHWESLAQSWTNATCSRVPQPNGPWQWISVDNTDSLVTTGPVSAISSQPFNQVMSDVTADYPILAVVDAGTAGGCLASAIGVGNLEGIRRQNELYVGQNGHFVYNNSTVLDMRPVKGLPPSASDNLDAQLATGTVTIVPVDIPKGFRWTHREGDWIDYNLRGQVVAYGDHNNNATWLARDSNGLLRGVVDGNGHVLMAFHYTGELLTGVSDFPISGNNLDLPARTVTYQYDANKRLAKVTDIRGNITSFGYDAQGHIAAITDPEDHTEQIVYTGSSVSQRIAADGGVTDYAYGFDDVNQQYNTKVTGPITAAGRRVDDTTYDNSGKLVRKITNGRTDDEVVYDTASRTESHTNARGFKTVLTRNEFEQVTRTDYPDGTNRQKRYSAQNQRLTETVDEAGIKTQYIYDDKANLLKKTEAVGTPDQRITEYQVNSLGQTTQITRKGRTESNGTVTLDATWLIEYDIQGQVSKITDPEGGVRQYVFDRAGNLAKFTDPLDHTARYESDADGNLVKVTDAMGRITAYAYDKVGNLTGMTDARGKQIAAAYDAMNRLSQITNSVGGIAKLQYDNNGQTTSVTDEDSRTVHAEFDNFQRLIQLSDGLGNQTRFGYNIPDGTVAGTLGSLSLPTEIKYPTFTQQNRLDQRERPTSDALLNINRTGAESLTSGTEYNPRGLVKSDTDAAGKQRFYNYDALGQLTEFTDSLGNKTHAFYDARGNLIQLTDANGNTYKFEYDRNDRVIREILPLGQATDYDYDKAGNLIQRLDPNGHKTTYSYDAANWLEEIKQYQDGTVLVRATILTWDDAHNLIAWSDTDATRPIGQQTASGTATYDDANRKTGETVTYPNPTGQPYSLSYSYTYSLAGKKTQLVWADGTAIDYGYSAHGELDSVTIPGDGILSVSQFKWTAPASVILPGGSVQNKSYDGLLKLEELKVKNPGQQTLLDLANSYGKRQELTTRARADTVEGVTGTVSGSFSYDDELRLTQSITDTGNLLGSDTETFTLDAVGNRIEHSRVIGLWNYDANNRLTDKGILFDATRYEYDDSGNPIRKTKVGKVTHYVYDTRNRLIQVKDGSGNLIARYGYDPFDRRIWKEQYRDKNGNVLAQARRSYYLYADEGLIAESRQNIMLSAEQTVSASAESAIATQYGPRPNGLFGNGVLLVKTINSNGGDTFAYYHHDHLDAPIQATDKNGNVVWSAQYNVFGQATITTPVASPDKPTISSGLRLPGQIEDEETGLHYNWHRYYEPGLGRYVTQDPIGLKGGLNTYGYVNNNPLRWIDPLGLFVTVSYDGATGVLILTDQDTGDSVTTQAESGGKPFGDPIPSGTYDILERQGRPDFYRLDKQDSFPFEDVDNVTGRDHFRLHRPGRTIGCIAAKDEQGWKQVDELIKNTKQTDLVPDNFKPWWKFWPSKQQNLRRYGTLTVH
jgi:RHS repeat-associated protein